MSVLTEPKAAEIIAGWRSDETDGQDNPAGPLFPGGDHAEQELTMIGFTRRCGSACTKGSGGLCC